MKKFLFHQSYKKKREVEADYYKIDGGALAFMRFGSPSSVVPSPIDEIIEAFGPGFWITVKEVKEDDGE